MALLLNLTHTTALGVWGVGRSGAFVGSERAISIRPPVLVRVKFTERNTYFADCVEVENPSEDWYGCYIDISSSFQGGWPGQALLQCVPP